MSDRKYWDEIENADPQGWGDPEHADEAYKSRMEPDPRDLKATPQAQMILNPALDKAGNDLLLPVYIRRHGRRKLTRTCQDQICQAIAAGGFEQDAAEAAGVPFATFIEWLAKSPNFRRNVMQAAAKAKLAVTQHIASKKPIEWATKGPGREKPGQQGFANQTQLTGAGGHDLKLGGEAPVDLMLLSEAELLEMRRLVGKASTKPDAIDAEFTVTEEKP